MNNDMMEIQIAAAPIRDLIPKDAPLRERIEFAMRYAREHERDLFWMSVQPNDDLQMRTALAAVMLAGDETDRDVITRSMKPLRMLSAAMQGIPVDFSGLDNLDSDLVPLIKLWQESKEPKAESDARKEVESWGLR